MTKALSYLYFFVYWMNKRTKLLLAISIGGYILVFILASFWKYNHFGYNALDLAIFNQVFYHTSLGNLFSLTIHPHSYLGDHFGLFIILLLPFYYLFRHPVTLLVLQTLVIGLSAWPFFLIVKKTSSGKLAFFLSVIFLLSPFVQNINLFEFHLLPFAIFFIFFTFYFYLSNRFVPFLIFSLLALTVREDVALVIVIFAILAFLDKKTKKWILSPLAIGLGWLALALFLIPAFTDYESYKFLFYYSWLGDSLKDIILNFFLHPLKVLSHVFSITNIAFILALFLPFLALPLLKPKYLVLSFLVFFQILLGGFSSELVLKTHYSVLLLPSVFLALAAAFVFLLDKNSFGKFRWQLKIKNFIRREIVLFFIIFGAVTIYAFFTFGPILPLLQSISSSEAKYQYTGLKNNYLDLIPQEQSVTTSYEFLPKLSGRQNIFSFHYVFVGKKQYSQETYELPNTDYLLLDTNDFLTFQIQYPPNSFYQDAYSQGDNRTRTVIQEQSLGLIKASDTILLFQEEEENKITPYEILEQKPAIKNQKNIKAGPKINFLGWDSLEASEENNPTFKQPLTTLPLSLYWQAQAKLPENFQLSLEIKDFSNNLIYQKYYPLAYGIYPATEWPPGKIIKTNYWFLIPESAVNKSNEVALKLVRLKENHHYLGLDGLLSAKMKNVEYEPVGEEIEIRPSDIVISTVVEKSNISIIERKIPRLRP